MNFYWRKLLKDCLLGKKIGTFWFEMYACKSYLKMLT